MTKDKVRAYTWIGIVSIVLGIIVAFQIKVVKNNLLDGNAPSLQSRKLMTEIEVITEQKKNLQTQVLALEKQLNTIKDETTRGNAIIESLSSELKSYKKLAGLTDVYGEGLKIIIDNNKNEYSGEDHNIVYEYDLLLNVINELNAAGAEAISINEQRIINLTEIRTAGNTLMVNKVPIKAPIELKVIGNSKILSASINQRFGIVSIIRNAGYFVEITENDKIIISKYEGEINFGYLENMDQ